MPLLPLFGGNDPPPPDTDPTGSIVLGLVSGTRDGKPLLVTTPTRCSAPATGEVYLGLVSGTRDGKPLVAFSTQRCDGATENLAVDRGYLGLLSGVRDGKPLLLVPCGPCDSADEFFDFCECSICCTLDATVEVGDGGSGWSAATDVTLTCGNTFQTHGGHYCCNEAIEDECFAFKITTTWAEKDNIASPEAYDFGTSSGTRGCFTKIWASDNFDIDGETYRLVFWYAYAEQHQALPTVSETTGCSYGYFLQHLASDEVYGSFWELVAQNGSGGTGFPGPLQQWLFTLSTDHPYYPEDCPDGYVYASGELIPGNYCLGTDNPSYTPGGSSSSDPCPGPVYESLEVWYRLATDPDIDANRIKCARITIADNCDPP